MPSEGCVAVSVARSMRRGGEDMDAILDCGGGRAVVKTPSACRHLPHKGGESERLALTSDFHAEDAAR
jgi:hypothetical protein